MELKIYKIAHTFNVFIAIVNLPNKLITVLGTGEQT